MSRAVVVLNADHSIINVVTWKRAINLIMAGKAEIMEVATLEDGKTTRVVHNFERTKEVVMPTVIRLFKFIKNVYKAKVSFTKKNVLIRDRFICAYCGSKEDLTVDHVVPSSKGGKTCWENCVACCQNCNYKKGNKSVEEAKMVLRIKPTVPGLVQYLQAKVDLFGLGSLSKNKVQV